MADSLPSTDTLSTDAPRDRSKATVDRSPPAPVWRVRRDTIPAPVREEARRLERVEQLLRSDRQS